MTWLGIDLGTSGVRCAVIDASGAEVAASRVRYAEAQTGAVDAMGWWDAAVRAIEGLPEAARADLAGGAVAGTSGSVVLVDAGLRPVGPGLLYDAAGFEAEAARIAAHAPEGSAQRGPAGALARLLSLLARPGAGRAAHLCHQADFVLARLTGRAGRTDETNALKVGHDPEAGWPRWLSDLGVPAHLLPRVDPVGAPAGRIDPDRAAELGLPEGMAFVHGATDSVAAFLATGADAPGDAVTSLGTTLVVKILSPRRIDDAARGVYSHRVGSAWLVGGASNSGAGVLAQHFAPDALEALSARIDPGRQSPLDYYPLPGVGERFPDPDPGMRPRLTPRPADDAAFLHGLLEGIAAIEARAFAVLADLSAPRPARVLTVGGGAQSDVWTAIRARRLGVPVTRAATTEASVGMARLAAPRAP